MDLTFVAGMAIEYDLIFWCENNYVLATTTLSNNIQTLTLAPDNIGQITVGVGQVLPVTFIVCATNTSGFPAQNTPVNVFINPAPEFGIISPRYGVLGGNTSITGEDGCAIFDSVTVNGTNSRMLSLIFVCQGAVITRSYEEIGIFVDTDDVYIHTSQSGVSEEGNVIYPVVDVTVIDSNGIGLSGKLVYAMLSMEANYSNIQFNSIYANPKVITNIVATSNSQGIAQFSSLSTIVGGSAGNYEIIFFCDGVASDPYPFASYPSTTSVLCLGCGSGIDLTNQTFDTSWYGIRVLNGSGHGVASKVVNLILEYTDANATIALNITNQDGFALWNPFISVPRPAFSAYLMVDGRYSMPFFILGLPPRSTEIACAFIEVLTPPAGPYIIGVPGSQPVVRAVDANGHGVPDLKISIGLQGTSFYDYQYFTNNELMNSYAVLGGGKTDESGKLDFGSANATSLQFLSGYSGSTPIVFLGEPDCTSDYHIVSVVSPIESVRFVPTTTYQTMSVVTPYEPVPFMATVYLSPSHNLTQVYPRIYVVAAPLYASTYSQSIFFGSGKTFSSFTISTDFLVYESPLPCNYTTNQGVICSFGDMQAIAFYGSYTLVAEVAGIQSTPLTINIPSNVSSLITAVPTSPSISVTMQQAFPEQPVVKVLDANGKGLYGAQVHAFLCNTPPNTVLFNFNNTQLNPISSPADENGFAHFGGLAIYSAPPGSYKLCFEVFNGTGSVPSLPWPVAITVSKFTVSIDIISNPRIVVTDQSWAIVANISTSLPVSTLVVNLAVTGSPFNSNYSLSGWTVWVENANGLALLDGISLADGSTPGEYEFTLTTCGYHSDTMTATLVSSPSFIKFDPDLNNTLVANINEVLEVPVALSVINGMPLSNAPVTAFLVNPSGNVTSTANLYEPVSTATTNSSGVANVKLIFTSGPAGNYSVYFQSNTLKTEPIQILLQNEATNISLTGYTPAEGFKMKFAEQMVPTPSVLVTDINQNPLPNVMVTATIAGLQGPPLAYMLTNEAGMASLPMVNCTVFVPGQYQIQFYAAGIGPFVIPVTVVNTLFPDFSNFDLHDAQVITFLICCLTIPLFIGNSVRQPAWQLALSVVALICLIYIKLSFEARFFSEKSAIFIALQDFTTLTFVVAPFTFLVVVYISIVGHLRKKRFNFYEVKKKSCEVYVKNLLLHSNDALQKYQEESAFKKLRWTFRVAWEAFISSFKLPDKASSADAFFFPQRMILGFGVSVCCLFMTATGCILLFSWPIYLLGVAHDNLSAYLILAKQLKNYIISQSGGMSPEAYAQQIVNTLTGLNISPFGSVVLMQILTTDIPRLLDWMQMMDNFAVFLRQALINSTYASVVGTLVLILFCKILVFPMYKHSILLLRRGRYKDVFQVPEDWSISSAANYIGLSAVHTAVGHFLLSTTVIIIASALQYKPFWHYLYSYYPVVIAFLIGFPFISKMTTKFIVGKFVVEKKSIKHFRIWVIFDFMWIFVNLLSVLALTTIRFVVGLLISFIMITRMDEPVFHSKHAHYDYGYSAYAGTLLMDHFHNNPILLVFVEHFIHDMKEQRRKRKENLLQKHKEERDSGERQHLLLNVTISVEDEAYVQNLQIERNQTIKRNSVANKWWLLYILTKNPSLQQFRAHNLPPPPEPTEKGKAH
eukprot:Phypoly_transcript_00288.p1 GENE.Phypoly_transcript_00288~~Phypoly_transcript_00288.p1  ORF type:complete len:1796 (+),score=227.23 Phypoly_transcript_00288:443-5389(+)